MTQTDADDLASITVPPQIASWPVLRALPSADAMPRLRSMKDLSGYWIEINRLENQADQIYRRLLAGLFNGDFGADTLTIMKLKEVVEELEAAADAFEKVAHKVESIAVKES
jgi:uncharacterized protein Yka (UPF0111/DUF47 family)